MEAAAQLFDREGLTATTNRIAARAGVSIGTLYQYFPNKHALMHALAERHLREARVQLDMVFRRLRESKPPFEESMRAILDVIVELHSDRPAMHRLMHRFAPRLPAELAALRAFEDQLADEIAYHLDRCNRGGDDTELTAQTLVHAVDAHLHRVMTRHKIDTEQLMLLVEQLTPATRLADRPVRRERRATP